MYALTAAPFATPDGAGRPRDRMAYYAGIGVTLWRAWLLLTGLGMLLAGVLPAGFRLHLAAPLTFLLLLLPMLATRAAVVAAVAGGLAVSAGRPARAALPDRGTSAMSSLPTLSHRDRAILRAVDGGTAELVLGAQPDLVVDGLFCSESVRRPRPRPRRADHRRTGHARTAGPRPVDRGRSGPARELSR